MSEKSMSVAFKFKVKPTSEGYLAEGIELSDIIIESKTQKQLTKDLDSALDCYFESFPEQKAKFIVAETEVIQKLEKQL